MGRTTDPFVLEVGIDAHTMLETALPRFEKALLTAGVPSAIRLRPGLSEADAARLEDGGPDLVTLYRWHDGVEPAEEVLRPSQSAELCYLMPGLQCADDARPKRTSPAA